jgi:hypothetical protein
MSMDAPFERGQSVAWLEFDPEGMRVFRAEVTGVSRETYATWLISTTHGQERVNDRGEGPKLVPVDADIADDFVRRGDGFLVRSTTHDIEQSLDQSLDWQSFEQNLGKGDGKGKGGHKL